MLQKAILNLSIWLSGLLSAFAPLAVLAADIDDAGEVPNPLGRVTTLFGKNGLIWNILEWAIVIAGVIAVIYIIVGGYQYMTGGEKGVETGRKTITSAVIGLIIVLVAFVIVSTIQGNILDIGSDYQIDRF